jgi:hypothetical protein
MRILSVPKIVADQILDAQAAGSEVMNEAFGKIDRLPRGAKVAVNNIEGAMIKVARRWETAIGQPGRWTEDYWRDDCPASRPGRRQGRGW